jgi:hypothetical protein
MYSANACSRPDVDGKAESQHFRKYLDGAESDEFLLAALFRNLSSGPRGSLGVDLDMPHRELGLQIDFVLELAVLKERALDPGNQSFHRALLVAAPGRTHLDADTNVYDRLREGGVVGLDVATLAALLNNRPRAIEDCHQRSPPNVTKSRARQRTIVSTRSLSTSVTTA